jgi:hypothetical protein
LANHFHCHHPHQSDNCNSCSECNRAISHCPDPYQKGDRSAEIARTTKKNKIERGRAAAEIAQIDKQLAQNSARIIATKQTLATNESTLRDIQLVVREGAVARVQLDRQQQQVDSLTLQLEELMKERSTLLIEKKAIVNRYTKIQKKAERRLIK